mmetsp:Transcript_19755/g.59688  ORF Transcript_19755/g.59688 Transcript_19755/m.59688 type:complete len:257 (+) Transcript_19755:1329-2099(+)
MEAAGGGEGRGAAHVLHGVAVGAQGGARLLTVRRLLAAVAGGGMGCGLLLQLGLLLGLRPPRLKVAEAAGHGARHATSHAELAAEEEGRVARHHHLLCLQLHLLLLLLRLLLGGGGALIAPLPGRRLLCLLLRLLLHLLRKRHELLLLQTAVSSAGLLGCRSIATPGAEGSWRKVGRDHVGRHTPILEVAAIATSHLSIHLRLLKLLLLGLLLRLLLRLELRIARALLLLRSSHRLHLLQLLHRKSGRGAGTIPRS